MFRRTTAHAKFHNLCVLLFYITSCTHPPAPAGQKAKTNPSGSPR